MNDFSVAASRYESVVVGSAEKAHLLANEIAGHPGYVRPGTGLHRRQIVGVERPDVRTSRWT